MVRKFSAIFLVVLLSLASFASAEETTAVQVEAMHLATGVENRQPVGVDTSFADTVGKVYCYTHIVGADEPTSVSHVWFYNDEEMATVELNVRSNNWRTWSSKSILKSWTGKWRVDVVTAAGELLESKEFTIEPSVE